MMKFLTPTLRICIGLVSLTVSLVFAAQAFGLIPDEEKAALQARAKISEALAIQLAVAASRDDAPAIKDTIDLVVKRSSDVLSVAMRRSTGEILVESGNHKSHWQESAEGRSKSNYVQVPLTNANSNWGRIEIAFRPLAESRNSLSLTKSMVILVAFLGSAGFVGFYFVLKRSLRELDPGSVIPERVQAAFDTIAEGVLILDEKGTLVLANRAFGEIVGVPAQSLFATKVNALPWLKFDHKVDPDTLPWWTSMREKKAITGVLMGVRANSAAVRRLAANATPILDGKGRVRGAIATFYDFTELHEKNEQLKSSINELRESQAQVEQKNKQLVFLASYDPLTECLNRRTFFSEFELMFEDARSQHMTMSYFMLDLDHFKSINDRFGHGIGDKVLFNFGKLLKECVGPQGLVGRYGGEEFCIAIAGKTDDAVAKFADQVCRNVAACNWLSNGERVTVSIGIASTGREPCGAMELISRADRALYAAKAGGRDRFIRWQDLPIEEREDVQRFKSELGSSGAASKDVRSSAAGPRNSVIAA